MSAIKLTLVDRIETDFEQIKNTNFTGVSRLTIAVGYISAQWHVDYAFLRLIKLFDAIANQLTLLDRKKTPLRRVDFEYVFPEHIPFTPFALEYKVKIRKNVTAALKRLCSTITSFPSIQELHYDWRLADRMTLVESYGTISKMVVVVPPREPQQLNKFFPCEMLQRSLITDIVKRSPSKDLVPRDVISIAEEIKWKRPPFDIELTWTYHPDLKKILRGNEYARENYPKAITFVRALWKKKQGCFSILTKESFARILSYLCIDDWKIPQEPTKRDREIIQEYLYQNKRQKK